MLKFIAIGLLITVTSCGFHLRGNLTFPKNFDSLTVISNDKFSKVYKKIINILNDNNITITNAKNNTNSHALEIINHQFSEQALFRDADGKTNNARLKLAINFKLFDKNYKLIKHSKIVSCRDLDINPNEILNTDNERNIIKQQLIDEAAHKVLQQVSSLLITKS